MTDAAIEVLPPDARLYALLAQAGFGPELFNAHQHRCCELIDRYVLHLAISLLQELDLAALLAEPRAVAELVAARRFAPPFAPALTWLLERLAMEGIVARESVSDATRYRLSGAVPRTAIPLLRATVLEDDRAYAPTLELLDAAAIAYLRVARGEASGEQALLGRVGLWCAYFANDNPYYALVNRMAAQVVAEHLRSAGAVLEVGAGLGSATQALLERLEATGRGDALAAYRFTEPVPFFRRRAERVLREAWPRVPFHFGVLDINGSWRSQGIVPESLAVVWGVNVFHLARDLDAALRDAFEALEPRGWLVLGEGIRPFPGQVVGAEFPFQLLRAFVDVATDRDRRPTHGFLTPEQWLDALRRIGFEPAAIAPDFDSVRSVFSGFFAGVVFARRPPG